MKNILLCTVLFIYGFNCKAQTISDVDGNVYQTVTIGTQVWMKENLKTTHYANDAAIPLVNTNSTWDALTGTSKAYCWYNDDIANKDTYGALYTWAAAMNGTASTNTNPSNVQGVCPIGWHLPSYAEWVQLTTYLGGGGVAGGKLKETGTALWSTPNAGATNETGFTAFPIGARSSNGVFDYVGDYANWWNSTEYAEDIDRAWFHFVLYIGSNLGGDASNKEWGFSVRCVKDNIINNISSLKLDDAYFYPNPSREKIYLKSSDYSNYQIMICDLQGNHVLSMQLNSNCIDISNLKKGIYVVNFIGSKNLKIAKLIKE